MSGFTSKACRRRLSGGSGGTWDGLAPTLVSLLPTFSRDEQSTLFLLIAKGKSICETRELECRRSFAELLPPCLAAGFLPPDVREQVSAFSRALVPPEEVGFLRVKSYVHSLAHVPRHGRCTLQTETIEYLDNARPDIVRALPGYKPPPEPPLSGRRWSGTDAKPRHSEQLHSLLDHSVFQKFQFLTIT